MMIGLEEEQTVKAFDQIRYEPVIFPPIISQWVSSSAIARDIAIGFLIELRP